jgi:hypothetical protein
MAEAAVKQRNGSVRTRLGLTLTAVGFIVYIIGADPGIIGQDRSPIIGILQILVFLVGLGIMCVGGYVSLSMGWHGQEKTIAADIGTRLVSTGYVIALGSAMADIFGFGSHLRPLIAYLGNWQAVGVLVGEAVIAIGFLLYIPRLSLRKPQL